MNVNEKDYFGASYTARIIKDMKLLNKLKSLKVVKNEVFL